MALDDFGSGTANINVALDTRFDFIKIDRSVIAGISASPRRNSTAALLVGMLGKLGATLVAEGIETAADCLVVQDMGFELLQGYFLRCPLCLAETTALIQSLHLDFVPA